MRSKSIEPAVALPHRVLSSQRFIVSWGSLNFTCLNMNAGSIRIEQAGTTPRKLKAGQMSLFWKKIQTNFSELNEVSLVTRWYYCSRRNDYWCIDSLGSYTERPSLCFRSKITGADSYISTGCAHECGPFRFTSPTKAPIDLIIRVIPLLYNAAQIVMSSSIYNEKYNGFRVALGALCEVRRWRDG